MRITRVYTRSGDDGTTGLGQGRRVPKNDPRLRAFGTVDELNATLGLAYGLLRQDPSDLDGADRALVLSEIESVQNLLFTLGGDLSVPLQDRWEKMPVISSAHTQEMERKIDTLNGKIPPLEEFVLPRGAPAVGALHLARTICRRAEREVLDLREKEPIDDAILPFLNRLSDFLFVLARWLCIRSGEEETTWNP